MLKGVRVVLVAPKGSTNIGAVARVCANFEVGHSCAVPCPIHIPWLQVVPAFCL